MGVVRSIRSCRGFLCDTSVILALVLLNQDKRTEQHQG